MWLEGLNQGRGGRGGRAALVRGRTVLKQSPEQRCCKELARAHPSCFQNCFADSSLPS